MAIDALIKGGLMPQVFEIKTTEFTVDCQICGFRCCKLLNWFPYWTGNKPCINLGVTIKEQAYSIHMLAIEHVHPDNTIGLPEWKVTNIGSVFQGKIPLRQLTEAGYHNYNLLITLEDKVGHYPSWRETLFATGNVPWRDSVCRGLLLFLGGAISWEIIRRVITLLIQR